MTGERASRSAKIVVGTIMNGHIVKVLVTEGQKFKTNFPIRYSCFLRVDILIKMNIEK